MSYIRFSCAAITIVLSTNIAVANGPSTAGWIGQNDPTGFNLGSPIASVNLSAAGLDQLAVGQPQFSDITGTNIGRVQIISADGSTIHGTVTGASPNQQLGFAVAGTPASANGGRTRDMIVSSVGPGTTSVTEFVKVIEPTTLGTICSLVPNGFTATQLITNKYGFFIAAELESTTSTQIYAVSAISEGGRGAVHLFRGGCGGSELVIPAPTTAGGFPTGSDGAFGQSIAFADIDGDGDLDMAVGAPLADVAVAGDNRGRVYVYDGAALLGTTPPAPIFTFTSDAPNPNIPSTTTPFATKFGTAVANAGNAMRLFNSSFPVHTLAIGAPEKHVNGIPNVGQVFFFGCAQGTSSFPCTPAQINKLSGSSSGAKYGNGVGALGDLDQSGPNPGHLMIAIGAPRGTGQVPQGGLVDVRAGDGRTNSPLGNYKALDLRTNSNPTFTDYGRNISTVGNVSGTSSREAAITEPAPFSNPAVPAKVEVLTSLDNIPLINLLHTPRRISFGFSCNLPASGSHAALPGASITIAPPTIDDVSCSAGSCNTLKILGNAGMPSGSLKCWLGSRITPPIQTAQYPQFNAPAGTANNGCVVAANINPSFVFTNIPIGPSGVVNFDTGMELNASNLGDIHFMQCMLENDGAQTLNPWDTSFSNMVGFAIGCAFNPSNCS